MTQLLSFHGDTTIKKKYVARLNAHAKADNQKLALKLAVALYGFGDYQIYEGDL